MRASYHGNTLQAFGELAYGLDLGSLKVEPYANLAYVRADSGSFVETGGDAKLAGAKASTDVTFTNLGLRTTASFDLGKANAVLHLGGGWRHAFGDTVPVTAMHYQVGGPAFAIGGLPFVRDAATLDGGLDIAISGNASIGLSYSGQIGERLADHSAKASISIRF